MRRSLFVTQEKYRISLFRKMIQNVIKFQSRSAYLNLSQISRTFSYWVHPNRKYGQLYENESQRSAGIEKLNINSEIPIKGVKKTFFVIGDKLGVGKTTISVNLALAIKKKYPEKKIGLLDTDPIDPTIPIMLGLQNKTVKREAGIFYPFESFGIQCMFPSKDPKSFWAEDDIFDTIEQLVREIAWEDLDLLIVDAPSSSNCLHGAFQEQMPMDASLLVTTGDSIALKMAKDTLEFYSKIKVPSAGVVVNFAQHKCPKCKHESPLYDKNHHQIEQILGQRVLQTFSFDNDIMKSLDSGNPFFHAYPQNIHTKYLEFLATQIMQFIERPIEMVGENIQDESREVRIPEIPSLNIASDNILNIKK